MTLAWDAITLNSTQRANQEHDTNDCGMGGRP